MTDRNREGQIRLRLVGAPPMFVKSGGHSSAAGGDVTPRGTKEVTRFVFHNILDHVFPGIPARHIFVQESSQGQLLVRGPRGKNLQEDKPVASFDARVSIIWKIVPGDLRHLI